MITVEAHWLRPRRSPMIARHPFLEKLPPLPSLYPGGGRAYIHNACATKPLCVASGPGHVLLRKTDPAKVLRIDDPSRNHGGHGSVEIMSGPDKRLSVVNQLPVSSETRGGHDSFIRNLLFLEEVVS